VENAATLGHVAVEALPTDCLYRPADLSKLTFSTTADLEPWMGLPDKRVRWMRSGLGLWLIRPVSIFL